MSVDKALLQTVTNIADKVGLFGGLKDSQIYQLVSIMTPVCVQQNDVIFNQGDQPTAMYVVLEGHVQLLFDINGQKLAKVQWGPGTCIGMTAVLGIQAHACTTQALEDCRLLQFTGESLMQIFEQDKTLFGHVMLNLARDASRRLHHTDQLIIEHMSANPEMLDQLLSHAAMS